MEMAVWPKPKLTGFSPRPGPRRTDHPTPLSPDIKLKVRQRLHSPGILNPLSKSNSHYQLWLECRGEQDHPHQNQTWIAEAPPSCRSTVTDAIASLYPLSLPKPSRMGSNTYVHFLSQKCPPLSNLPVQTCVSPGRRAFAVSGSTSERKEWQQLRVRSEARAPPLDDEGNILPPENFKRHYTNRKMKDFHSPGIETRMTPALGSPPSTGSGFPTRMSVMCLARNSPVYEQLINSHWYTLIQQRSPYLHEG
ncbi:testis-expressed protein 52-like [Erpetoichthys calabaricus]|uniref:testis-expressed protein 52-like n=1 Tax=Erpetoichthys calabaricus TaxID=27687 RepID=UPI0022346474|nr:testis-expressed protein 52-like [Erpetoichthys calabaricus]XP_051778361.1 testis-expressed protein 52-like [Erpetoichthys calabaricus]